MLRTILFLLGLLVAQPSWGAIVNDVYCLAPDKSPKRQTILVIDGRLINPESKGRPAEENQNWRRFVRHYTDAGDRQIRQIMAPGERITIALANADGTGLTPLFSGCLPLLSKQDADRMRAERSTFDSFFKGSFDDEREDAHDTFRRDVSRAIISEIPDTQADQESGDKLEFVDIPFVSSLRRSPGFSEADGLMRYIILADFTDVEMPASDAATARRKGFADAAAEGVDMHLAEVHLFAKGLGASQAVNEYLDAFFLRSKGRLITISGLNAGVAANNVPLWVREFQGAVEFPNIGKSAVRLRLAADADKRVIMSWMEVQRRKDMAIPIDGVLVCDAAEKCTYQGNEMFAQVWSENPDPEVECHPDMPMGGMRTLDFTMEDQGISAKVSDMKCYVEGYEDGLSFELEAFR